MFPPTYHEGTILTIFLIIKINAVFKFTYYFTEYIIFIT